MALANFSIELLAILFGVAIIAGFIDTLAGGGGLISVPALILSGVPPIAALGTNKLQGSMGTATATLMMLKNKRVSWQEVKQPMLFAFIGSAVGTLVLQFVNSQVLSYVIPVVLGFMGFYFLLSPNLAVTQKAPRVSQHKYQHLVVPAIGCYDGFFGPGTGSFFALAGTSLRGHGLLEATAIAKTLNFSTNIASLIVFLIADQVIWLVGLTMMLGQVLGAWLGASCLFSINPKYLRLLVVAMCAGMLARYALIG